MPFVQATRENIERIGLEALRVGLAFDEAAVLQDNAQYLRDTLDVSLYQSTCIFSFSFHSNSLNYFCIINWNVY